MKKLLSIVGLGASACVLFAVVVLLVQARTADPRADLQGASVRSTLAPPSTPPRSAPPRSAPPRSTVPLPTTRPAPTSVPAIPASPNPVRISIPSIEVDALIVPVGLESDGSMEIPGPTDAGWYHYGARPGAPEGSAVIAAHVDSGGQPGAFLNLGRLDIGQEVQVRNEQGVLLRYRVTERFQIDKDELPGPELFRTNGDPTLTLITCGGRFNRKLRRYADNIVVRAVPITREEIRRAAEQRR